MLEKPDIEDERIIDCLRDEFGLPGVQVAFLPLGADVNTAVYRADAPGGAACFVKLRRGAFDETSVALPRFLYEQGIGQIIPPLPTLAGRLRAELDAAFKLILYPYIAGRDAYQVNLTDNHWRVFGAALRRIQAVALPPALARHIQRETYSPRWRDIVTAWLDRVEHQPFTEPLAAQVAALLRAKRADILDLVTRTERLARMVHAGPPELVLCHSDVHAGNLHIAPDGALYIVDWDNPILAPRERDLMYPGGGLCGRGHTPEEEVALFFEGYGPADVDPAAVAYYRYERIVQDIAAYCDQLLLSNEGGEDREQSFRWLASNFLPDHVLDIAYRAARAAGID